MVNRVEPDSPEEKPPCRGLPSHDYVSPNLDVIIPDAAFPNMRVGDLRIPQWIWLRKWVPHNWYIDKALPYAGFASRDEAAIIYNTALNFRGRPCLEVGCWRGWSTVHFALGAGSLHVIDPVIDDPEFAASIYASCAAAGVLDKIEFHAGYSPGAIDELSKRLGIKWSFIFIDAEHEGDAPRLDAEAALRNAGDDAIVLFHDLSSPFVAAALHKMRDAGWRTMVYQTMQIMGVAWRGNVEPVHHIPDPTVFWTLPGHLAGYEVSGWRPYRLPHNGGAWWPKMTIEDQRNAAMMLAQEKEDRLASEILEHENTRSDLHSTATQLTESYQKLERLSSERSALNQDVHELSAIRRANMAQIRLLVGRLLEDQIVAVNDRTNLLNQLSNERIAYSAQLRSAEDERDRVSRDLARQTQRFAVAESERSHHDALQQEIAAGLSAQAATSRAVVGLLRRNFAAREVIIRSWAKTLGLTEQGTEDLLLRFNRTRAIFGLLRRSYRSREALLLVGIMRAAAIRDHSDVKLETPVQSTGMFENSLRKQCGGDDATHVHLISLPSAWHLLASGAGTESLGDLQRYFVGVDIENEHFLSRIKTDRLDTSNQDNLHLLNSDLASIRASALWNPIYYREVAQLKDENIDPAVHYLIIGEVMGFAPSHEFDPKYYAQMNPDVWAGGMCLLAHYINHGVKEARAPQAPQVVKVGGVEWDKDKENVIIVAHESSRTGAPILAWNIAKTLAQRYNVFSVILRGGALVPDFYATCTHVCGPFPQERHSSVDLRFALSKIFSRYSFKYAIVNSTESRAIIETCSDNIIPIIFLVHEFGTYVYQRSELISAFDRSDAVVFPARLVANSSISIYPSLDDHALRILPQGKSELPLDVEDSDDDKAGKEQLETLQTRKSRGAFLVLGAGTVSMRKGVDLFLSVAASVIRNPDAPPLHFVWIGQGYRPQEDMNYSVYLLEQLARAGLTEHVTFLDETPDLDAVYALADAFLLTSRLDPLPNVSIDAAWKGIPTVCFENASGTADLLAQDPVTAIGVVPYLDVGAAGAALVRLAGDRTLYTQVSRAMETFAQRNFDIKRYVDKLDELGTLHACEAQKLRTAAQIVASAPSFSADFFTGAEYRIEEREEAARRYVVMWHKRSRLSSWMRRPAPGFNAYAWLAVSGASAEAIADPYAAFLAAGSPSGPWQLPVLRHLSLRGSVTPTCQGAAKALLHVHTDDVAIFSQMLSRLVPLDSCYAQVIVSAPNKIRSTLRQVMEGARIRGIVVEAELPDALSLAHFLEANTHGFDPGLVANLRATSDQVIVSCRDFHWDHVLGGRLAAAEEILTAFEQDDRLGLVFAADPYYPTWDETWLKQLTHLTGKIIPDGLFEKFQDYPESGMFWARRDVMRSLAQIKSEETNSPGLSPGAIGRLLPEACSAAERYVAVVTSLASGW